jgi:hypothetical protein
VTFRLHRSRLWLGIALILAPVWLVLRCLHMVAMVALGMSLDTWHVVEAAVSVLLVPVAGGAGAVLGAGGSLGWVRASAAGLEFAASRRKPVFVAWNAIQSVRLRFAGPLTELVVIPTSLDAVTIASVPGQVPRLRRRAGAPEFTIDVGMMTPGPSVLLAELNRRLAHHS